MGAALMLQGTGSGVGKSLLTAGLCRLFHRRYGLKVCPFKPQNMSNNAAVTSDGGEIGRAQALQAQAAGLEPSVHMNPVLLKPQSDRGSQVVVRGRVQGTTEAGSWREWKETLLPLVLDSYHRLAADADLMLVEGAGSPAEINLRAGDIANMGFAEAADLPVVLVADIDRGGVLASVTGTHALLPEAERTRIQGFIVNRFRGDRALFADGLQLMADRTGWPALGLVPWLTDAARLPEEDSANLSSRHSVRTRNASPDATGRIHIAVPSLSRISNIDDLDPLAAEPDVTVEFVPPGRPLPGDADLILIAGTKATLTDLAFLRAQGWDQDLRCHLRRGGRVLGLCGGYQMLGHSVADPDGIEGPAGSAPGLGLLDIHTRLHGTKTLRREEGQDLLFGRPVHGYRMHTGDSTPSPRPLLQLSHGVDGCISGDGLVLGCYLHGLFISDPFRTAFLADLHPQRPEISNAYRMSVESTLDSLSEQLENAVAVDRLLALARTTG